MALRHRWVLVHDETRDNDERRTHRMRVRGGYLYRYEFMVHRGHDSFPSGCSIAFVPDARRTPASQAYPDSPGLHRRPQAPGRPRGR